MLDRRGHDAIDFVTVRDITVDRQGICGELPALPGYGFQALMFRKDLVDSGQLRTPADLRGLRIGISARGTSGEPDIAAWLQPHGMTLDDVEMVELAFPEHAAALAGRTLDASMNLEPFVTFIVDQGTATIYERLDTFVPSEQIAEVIYGGQFANTGYNTWVSLPNGTPSGDYDFVVYAHSPITGIFNQSRTVRVTVH